MITQRCSKALQIIVYVIEQGGWYDKNFTSQYIYESITIFVDIYNIPHAQDLQTNQQNNRVALKKKKLLKKTSEINYFTWKSRTF